MKPSKEYVDSLVSTSLKELFDDVFIELSKKCTPEQHQKIESVVRLVLYDRLRLLGVDDV